MAYEPLGPYVLGSGKKAGQAVELIIFHDYRWLKSLYNKQKRKKVPEERKNRLHLHLDWLMNKADKAKPLMLCPHCGQKKIELISALGSDKYGFSMGTKFSCCLEAQCKQNLLSWAGGGASLIIPAKIFSVSHFKKRADQKKFIKILRHLYGLEGKLSKEAAFAFFKNI